MQFADNTPTKETTIQNILFVVPQPFTPEVFAEGALNGAGSPEVWARKMNQTLLEDLRNNFAARMKSSDTDLTQADFDAYVTEYVPGIRRTSTGPARDPITAEALKLVKIDLRMALKEKRQMTVAKKEAEPTEGQISFDKFIESIFKC